MPTIHLLRHGQASFGTDDYDVLSDLGREQASRAARELARRGVHAPVVISGTLRRQADTAAIAASALGTTVAATDPRLDEFDAHGLVDAHLGGPGRSGGLTSAAFQEQLDVAMTAWIEEGDDWAGFADGAVQAVSSGAERVPRGGSGVLVTSAGVSAAICAALLGGGASTVVALNRVSVNASLTTLAVSARRISVVAFNDHAHLLGEPGLLTYR